MEQITTTDTETTVVTRKKEHHQVKKSRKKRKEKKNKEANTTVPKSIHPSPSNKKPRQRTNQTRNPKTTLPIFAYKQEIVQAVCKNRVVIITGETGSGKSTQVPSYILDDCYSRKEKCKIVCTQPRRLAATSLAKRVAKERETEIGRQVGFVIGGNSQATRSNIVFATTGCVLEMFLHNNKLSQYSHIIVDEVHERDVDNDLLLNFMRTVLHQNSTIKLILMSATIDPKKFVDYFSEFKVECQIPYIHVPSGCYHVAERYLDDCFNICPCEKQFKSKVMKVSARADLSEDLKHYAYQFILKKHSSHSKEHAYLVFLPGIDSIIWFAETLKVSQSGYELDIHVLHSTVSMEDQEAALLPSPDNMRKIILATNVAESSITVPDVQVVIDFCFTKQMVYDPTTRSRSLNQVYISKASAKQRRGRAGRVKDGEVYRMVSKKHFDQMDDHASPKIQTESLEHTILKILKINCWKSPEEVLSQCIDPPDISAIGATYESLKELGAVELDESSGNYLVTPIGDFLSSLPLSLQLGRLVLYGYAFGYLPECIIMASIISKQSPIIYIRDYTVNSLRKRLEYAHGTESDIIAGLYAFNKWFIHKHKSRSSFFQLKTWCMKHWLSRRWLDEIENLVLQIDQKLSRYDMCIHFRNYQGADKSSYNPSKEYSEKDVTILKVLLAAAMMENMQKVTWAKESNHTFPKNFIKEHSIELINISLKEVDSIKQFYECFEGGIGQVEKVNVNVKKKEGRINAFVQFKDDNETKAIDAVKMALRLKRKDFSKVVNQSEKNVKGGRDRSAELDIDIAETFMIDDAAAQDNFTSKKKSYMQVTDFLAKDMLLEHDFKFEFVKAFKGISNLKLTQMHHSVQNTMLSSSSVVFPLIVPPGTTELSLVVLPAVLYGINFGSQYLASENTLLPRVAGIAELIMLLFAQNVKYTPGNNRVVAQFSVNRIERKVNLSTQEPNKHLMNIRQRLHQCFDSLRVRKGGRKSTPSFNSREELTDACFKLIENIESVVEVTRETRQSKPPSNTESSLAKSIEITIPDGSHRQIYGRNGRYLAKMSKESGGALLELVDFETVRIAYNSDKQLKKAEKLLKKAINNYHIVFEHPQEAYILLSNIKSDAIGFLKYKDSRNEKRELFALHSPTQIQPDFALEQDFSVESLHHTLAQQEKKLVKGCFLVYEHTHEYMLKRFVSKMHSLTAKKNTLKEYKVELYVGKQLFYPAAASRSKPKLKLSDQTVMSINQFKSFEIGTQQDIKTEFLSAFHPQDQILAYILDYLNQHAAKQEETEFVNIHFIDVKRRERVHGKMVFNNGNGLEIAQLSLAQKSHMYMSMANISSNVAEHGLYPDYRLKLVDKEIIHTDIKNKKTSQRKKWLTSIKWNRETNTIEGIPDNGNFEVDIIRHTTQTKFSLKENIISVSHVTTDVDVSVEIHVENRIIQEHLSRKNFLNDDEIYQIIESQMIPETVALFSQWRLHVDSEGYSQLVANSTRVDT